MEKDLLRNRLLGRELLRHGGASVDLSRRFDAKLTLVHVHEPRLPGEVDPGDTLETNSVDIERGMDVWRIEAARRLGAPVRSMVRLGDAAAEILRLARDEGFDLIVFGAGDKGLKALVLGSVAELVARRLPARCS